MAACQSNMKVLDLIIPSMNAVAIASMLPLIYSYCKKLKSTKALYYLGLSFYGMIIISLFTTIIWQIQSRCYDHQTVSEYMKMAISITYGIQGLFLVIILFTRLHQIFRGTSFGLSRCTTTLFISVVVFVMLLTQSSIIGYYVLSVHSPDSIALLDIFNYIWLFGSVVYIMSLVWLNALFVYKMQKVFKLMHNKTKIMNVITKATVLCAVPSSTTLFSMVILFSFGEEINLLLGAALLIDFYCSFLSIWLSYDCFYGYYLKVCGCFDGLCKKMCIRPDAQLAKLQMKRSRVQSSSSNVPDDASPNTSVQIESSI